MPHDAVEGVGPKVGMKSPCHFPRNGAIAPEKWAETF